MHARVACQKVVPASRDASGHRAAKAHYKSQPISVLSHPLLWPSSPSEQGECEAPPCPPHSPKAGLSSMDLSAAISCVPCQMLGLLVVGESRGRRFVMEEGWAFSMMAPGLEPRARLWWLFLGSGRMRPRSPHTSLHSLQLTALPVPWFPQGVVTGCSSCMPVFSFLPALSPRCRSCPQTCPATTSAGHASPAARPRWPAAAMSPASGSARTPPLSSSPLLWW